MTSADAAVSWFGNVGRGRVELGETLKGTDDVGPGTTRWTDSKGEATARRREDITQMCECKRRTAIRKMERAN